MSDTRQGDDWWLASDGKWYPPTSMPSPPAPPPQAERTPAARKKGSLGVWVLGACVAIGGCVGVLAAASNDDEADSGAQLACRRFRSLAADYSAGILTLTEVRDRTKGIHSSAQVSTEPGIATAAADMLAAATAFDLDALTTSVRRMGAACESAGL